MVDEHELNKSIIEVMNKNQPSNVEITKTISIKAVDDNRKGKATIKKVTKGKSAKRKTVKRKTTKRKVGKKKKVVAKVVKKRIKRKTRSSTKTTQSTLISSVNKLTGVVKELVKALKDKKDEASHKKIMRRLTELEQQNQKLARGILAVADLVKNQGSDESQEEQLPTPEPQPMRRPPVNTEDLTLPGRNQQQGSMPRLQQRRPLFLNRAPSFTEVPQQQQQAPREPMMNFPELGSQQMPSPQAQPPIQQNTAPLPPFSGQQQPPMQQMPVDQQPFQQPPLQEDLQKKPLEQQQ